MRRTALLSWLLLVSAASLRADSLSRDLYAFDNGTGRDQKLPFDRQAELLAESGFAGMGLYTSTVRLPEMMQALDGRKLPLLAVYSHAFVDSSGPRIDPNLPEVMRELKGRDVMIMLTLRGTSSSDDAAVGIVREVADAAAAAGLRVCLYPHLNFFIETAADGVRVLGKAARPNTGVALNLVHEWNYHARAGGPGQPDWTRIVRHVDGRILMASINGAGRGKDGQTTIVRLDRSEVDIVPFLRALDQAGFGGPVSLQAVGVTGDVAANLRAAMAEWRRLRALIP
jgi:sugar phosphate isomerase/epimerase